MASVSMPLGGTTRRGLTAIIGSIALLGAWLAAPAASQTAGNGCPGTPARSAPPGYTCAWSDEFSTLSLDSQGSGGFNWSPRYTNAHVFAMDQHRDRCLKEDVSFRAAGQYGGYPDNPSSPTPPRYAALNDPRRRLTLDRATYPNGQFKLHEVKAVSRGNNALSLYGVPIPYAQMPANEQDQFWGYEAMCGMLNGSRSFGQTYGHWETRMRLANVPLGVHVALWLGPSDDTWPPEIDLVEAIGTNPANGSTNTRFLFNAHFLSAPDGTPGVYPTENSVYPVAPKGPTAWYKVAVRWTPTTVTWYLDDRQVHQMSSALLGTKPLSFMVTTETSSFWPGLTTTQTDWPVEIQLDYLRIYRPT